MVFSNRNFVLMSPLFVFCYTYTKRTSEGKIAFRLSDSFSLKRDERAQKLRVIQIWQITVLLWQMICTSFTFCSTFLVFFDTMIVRSGAVGRPDKKVLFSRLTNFTSSESILEFNAFLNMKLRFSSETGF